MQIRNTMTERQIIDVADLDCIYLSYDEPKKEEFWIRIQNMVPWARRVDGIKGSDAAHKAAADASDTDRFILIDGDNIPDPEFFNLQLVLDSSNRDCVFRWRARNHINGLMYGNGGMSSWTKDFIRDMRTHENTDGTAANDVEFCFYPNYWSMNDCYSTTYPNATPFQAWRAGFREGVKMCLDRGVKPSLEEFERRVNSRNYDHLCVWQSVGADVENGFWAIYGARLGTFMIMLEGWNYREVQDFDTLARLWVSFEKDGPDQCASIGDTLRTRLGLPIVDMDPSESKFFKYHYKSQFKNQGPMVRE
jgi:hypothetical protein